MGFQLKYFVVCGGDGGVNDIIGGARAETRSIPALGRTGVSQTQTAHPKLHLVESVRNVPPRLRQGLGKYSVDFDSQRHNMFWNNVY